MSNFRIQVDPPEQKSINTSVFLLKSVEQQKKFHYPSTNNITNSFSNH